MTDQPRFRPVKRQADEAWRDHHGAPLVDLAFRIADAWPRDDRRFRHVLRDRRALVQPVAGLASARTVFAAAIAIGLIVWALAAEGRLDDAASRVTAVAGHLHR